jgi:GTP pyrophosphokinase
MSDFQTIELSFPQFFSGDSGALLKEVFREKAAILNNDLGLDSEPALALVLKELENLNLITEQQIREEYGIAGWELIAGLRKIERLDVKKYAANAENFIKLLLTLSDDIRVILVRLGMQLYDMRHLDGFPAESQPLIVRETSLLYVPIAHRIGLYRIKTQLEDRVMEFNEPEAYTMIGKKLLETQNDRDQHTDAIIRPIRERLKQHGFDCEIRSRVKSIPSIYRKMLAQKVDFEKVYDLFAIRIILNQVVENEKADCWKIYSLVTDIFTPNPRRLRDWITFPKSTGYESLHTTVVGPECKWVEVQIRTRRMDEVAEKGFAAHWKYKSDGNPGHATDLFTTIREMLETPVVSINDPRTSRDKRTLYTDEIFIFTPKGDLKRLKPGHTVLDFAFEIHTGIGSTCTGAIVNGKMVPLKHVLHNGDTVKILTSKNQKPNAGWLDIVKSTRTLARIKHALRMETYKESEYGKEILRNKFAQLGTEFNDLAINKLIGWFECENIMDLYQRFGEGKLDPSRIKRALAEQEAPVPITPVMEPGFSEQISGVLSGKEDYLVIDNRQDRFHYDFAKCCNPVPGTHIFAFVSVSQGIRIHRTDCPNARQLITRYPYRILEARWKEPDPNRQKKSPA